MSVKLLGSRVRPTNSGFGAAMISSGRVIFGTSGMLATLKPRLARYMHVGVFDVRETPTKIISASTMVDMDWPSSCCTAKCMASMRLK